ncbi:MAG: hypothetical protein M3540_06305, partial [Actinomycetota bacterium]|nr:hypothetical protein [Actinomycetota bacterium]
MASLQVLQERRAYECRLTPDRALATIEESEEFLRDRGLLTRTPDSALPSLYEACHEDPYSPGGTGFGSWPATKWPWFGELAERDGVYRLNVHRGKNLLVTAVVAALIDPICRGELDRMATEADDWALVLGHLDAAGPALLEDLRTELPLKPKELKAALSPLELCGAVVRRTVVLETAGGGHEHTSELARWDQVYTQPSARGGLAELVVAAVHAAVVAPEREV